MGRKSAKKTAKKTAKNPKLYKKGGFQPTIILNRASSPRTRSRSTSQKKKPKFYSKGYRP